MKKRFICAALIAASAMMLGGCGNNGTEGSETTTVLEETTEAATDEGTTEGTQATGSNQLIETDSASYELLEGWEEAQKDPSTGMAIYCPAGVNMADVKSTVMVSSQELDFDESNVDTLIEQAKTEFTNQGMDASSIKSEKTQTKNGITLVKFDLAMKDEASGKDIPTTQYYVLGNGKVSVIVAADMDDSTSPSAAEVTQHILDTYNWK